MKTQDDRSKTIDEFIEYIEKEVAPLNKTQWLTIRIKLIEIYIAGVDRAKEIFTSK